MQVAATHWQHFDAHADAHGLSAHEYAHHARRVLDRWLADAEVRVRIDAAKVQAFLRDGRYLTQFEVGASGGLFHPARRILLEQTLLGIPPEARARDRPVYGYLSVSDESGLVQQYGDVIMRLRPRVRWRTTFTFGDSLDTTTVLAAHPLFSPAPLARPTSLALDPRVDVLTCGDAIHAVDARYGYVEAQIHGALTPTDVEEMVFTLNVDPDQPTIELLEDHGTPWRTVVGTKP